MDNNSYTKTLLLPYKILLILFVALLGFLFMLLCNDNTHSSSTDIDRLIREAEKATRDFKNTFQPQESDNEEDQESKEGAKSENKKMFNFLDAGGGSGIFF